MIKINDRALKESYIQENNIGELFTEDMRAQMELILVKRNEYICKQGERLDYLLFLVEGKAKVYVSLENGRRLLLCFYEGFQVLGDMEVLEGKAASTNVQALEDSYFIGIPLANTQKVVAEDPKFLRFICTTLGRKLGRCSHNSSINLLYPLENRLASYIVRTSKSENGEYGEYITFGANLSEVAELLGTSYRHLLRTLDQFCEGEYLQRKKHYFEVMNYKKLKELAVEVYL